LKLHGRLYLIELIYLCGRVQLYEMLCLYGTHCWLYDWPYDWSSVMVRGRLRKLNRWHAWTIAIRSHPAEDSVHHVMSGAHAVVHAIDGVISIVDIVMNDVRNVSFHVNHLRH